MSYTIIGIDPGSSLNGTATIEIDDTTLEILNVSTMLINAVDLKHPKVPDLAMRTQHIFKEFTKLIKKTKPVLVAFESMFIFARRPGAVIPLAKTVSVMELVLTLRSIPIRFTSYAPMRVKKDMGASKDTSKENMLVAVSDTEEITKHISKKELNKISEHEIDAIAIAYSLLKDLRRCPDILLA